jgi:hypothetical protein
MNLRISRRSALRSIASMCALGSISGCGYTWSDNGNSFSSSPDLPSKGIYPDNVRTVAVPIFANKTYQRGIEFSLSKAVINQMESRTPYKVTSREKADTVLEAQIVDAGVRYLSRNLSSALPQEQMYFIIVNFTWKDLRTGRILVDRRGFSQHAPYYPTLGEDPYVGAQDNIEKLSIAIVEELQAPWGNIPKNKKQPS